MLAENGRALKVFMDSISQVFPVSRRSAPLVKMNVGYTAPYFTAVCHIVVLFGVLTCVLTWKLFGIYKVADIVIVAIVLVYPPRGFVDNISTGSVQLL